MIYNLEEQEDFSRVCSYWWLIQYVSDPSKRIQLAAIRQNPNSFGYIRCEPHEEAIVLHEFLWKL